MHEPAQREMDRGTRVSLRRVIEGGQSDVMGWVTAATDTDLTLVDRWARIHVIARDSVIALRRIPLVPAGRNPVHGDAAMLAHMLSDLTGSQVPTEQVAVARLSEVVTAVGPGLDLLPTGDSAPGASAAAASPMQLAWGGGRVVTSGEWAALTAPDARVQEALAAWAVLHNARNLATWSHVPTEPFRRLQP